MRSSASFQDSVPCRIATGATNLQTPEHGFNAVSRGVYISDNLALLRSINDECIDLVCIDPPFAKNETFAGDKLKPPLTTEESDNELRLLRGWGISNAKGAAEMDVVWPSSTNGGYRDIWTWEDDIHEEWLTDIERNHESIYRVIDATRYAHSDGIAAYLCYMAIRLIEVHRVLKPTGSLFLHCDHTANGYLRLLLDVIFGTSRLRREIVWVMSAVSGFKSLAPNFIRGHDTILYYAKGDNPKFNKQYLDFSEKQLKHLSSVDEDGRRYISITKDQRLYLDQAKGIPISSVWSDIANFQTVVNHPERTGYETQKPSDLAARVVEASTDEDDVVLDCFAGCAYTAIAAEKLGRRWVACDLNPRAWTVFKRQFNKPELVPLRCNDETTGQQVIGSEPVVTVHGPGELPVRTSPVRDDEPRAFSLPVPRFKVPASIIPQPEMLDRLLELSDFQAWCCGFANRRANGEVVRVARNFHLDHIDPKSKQGSNQIPNRAPLCPHHNTRKGNKRIHLADYREQIAHAGEMMVSPSELIDLAWAYEKALEIYADARRRDGV